MSVSDLDIEEINKSIVATFNEDPELLAMLRSDDIKDNSTVVEIVGKRRTSGFVMRGDKAEIIKGGIKDPTVKFTVISKDVYYLMIEDIINGVDVRSMITAMVFSSYPKIVMEPPVEQAGMYHLEALIQLFSRWSDKIIGGLL